jgi:hypothetical protein
VENVALGVDVVRLARNEIRLDEVCKLEAALKTGAGAPVDTRLIKDVTGAADDDARLVADNTRLDKSPEVGDALEDSPKVVETSGRLVDDVTVAKDAELVAACEALDVGLVLERSEEV